VNNCSCKGQSSSGYTKTSGSCRVKMCKTKEINETNPGNDENWAPSQAFKYCSEFKKKYNIELNDNMISELVASLNKIWREREKKIVSRTKTKYESEVLNLRRQMTMKTGFDEFSAMKEISKLKNELKQAREDCRNYLVVRNKIQNGPSGIELVDNAMKIANNFQKSKKIMQNEIDKLNKKVGDKEFRDNYDRLKFNEGSLWMIGRCYNEIESLQKKILEIIDDYQSRLKSSYVEGEFNNKLAQNAHNWFLEILEKLINDTVDKFKDWHYNNIKNVDTMNVNLNS